MGLMKRKTRSQRRMHGTTVHPSSHRATGNGDRLRRINGVAVWVHSHNESPHSATKPKRTSAQRKRRRQIAAASRRRNRTR